MVEELRQVYLLILIILCGAPPVIEIGHALALESYIAAR